MIPVGIMLLCILAPLTFYFIRWFVDPLIQSFNQKSPFADNFTLINPDSPSSTPSPSPSGSGSDSESGSDKSNGKLTAPPLLTNIEGTLDLTLVAPAYNEQERINACLTETMKYLNSRNFNYELLIIDDGSKDKTVKVALEWVEKFGKKIKIFSLHKNVGKGGAVQQGVLNSNGKLIIFLDSDGATNIFDLDRLIQQINLIKTEGLGIAIGSRSHLQDQAVSKRAWYRNILMFGFHFLVSTIGGIRSIRDTQCGFKLFTRKAARELFINQRLRRWCFDIELLHIAQAKSIPIVEVPVNWQEIPGSKLSLLSASLNMFRDMIIIRFAYLTGLWTIQSPDQILQNIRNKKND